MNIFEILKKAVEMGASDIHVTVNKNAVARVKGKFIFLTENKLTSDDTEKMVMDICKKERFEKLKEEGEIDFSTSIECGTRFRVNAYTQKSNYALAIRTISSEIPKFESLGLPSVLKTLAGKNKGLVLVTGPTGSGKSTTLASLIDIINTNSEKHIITLEDPIEYVHEHKLAIVNQREIGRDSKTFNNALRAILRQDPDVILIGEMRDPETVSIALTAAETGHLVFSTLHTVGAAKTIDRIVDMFSHEQQQQVRTQLSTVCEGVISQQLIPTADGNGRVAALEIMIATPAIRNLIRENKTYQIQSSIQTGSKFGMQDMDKGLVDLVMQGKITKDAALNRCSDYEATSKMLGGASSYFDMNY